jgi:hypothetical protein
MLNYPEGMSTPSNCNSSWKPMQPGVFGVALALFVPPTGKQNAEELPLIESVCQPLLVGDIVHILEQYEGTWFRGYCFHAGIPSALPAIGIFPCENIHIFIEDSTSQDVLPSSASQHNSENPNAHFKMAVFPDPSSQGSVPSIAAISQGNIFTSSLCSFPKENLLPPPTFPCVNTEEGKLDPVIDEASAALRDWCLNLRRSLTVQGYDQFFHTRKHLLGLLKGRRRLMLKNLPEDRISSLRKELILRIYRGNNHQGIEQVIRNPNRGEIASDVNTSTKVIKVMYEALPESVHWKDSHHLKIPQVGESMDETLSKSQVILLDIKSQFHTIGQANERTEFRFSIYSKQEGTLLSDDFIVFHEGSGTSVNPGTRALFTNFSTADLSKDLILFCRIIRHGKVKDADPVVYRRPHAAGILDLREILMAKEGQSIAVHEIKLFSPMTESSFPKLPFDIMERGNLFEPLKTDSISVSLRALDDINHPNLENIFHCQRIGFGNSVDFTQQRNSFYVTLERGDFLKSLGKTFEVAAEIRDASGKLVPGTVIAGAGLKKADSHEVIVYHHALTPEWSETIRFDIPENLMSQVHLYLQVRPCSSGGSADKKERVAAFGFKPIIKSNGAVIADGFHVVNLFKYDKKCTSDYLKDDLTTSNQLKDTISIKTYLVSTSFSQNVCLVKLLKWEKSLSSTFNDLPSVLQDLKLVPELELCKFSVQIINALLGVLCSPKNETGELSKLVFDNFLSVLNLIYLDKEGRYGTFKILISDYIDKTFKEYKTAKYLFTSFIQVIEEVRSNPKNTDALRLAQLSFKLIDQVFHLILQCGILLNQGSNKSELEIFKDGFSQFFISMEKLMGDPRDHLITLQQLALQNFSGVVPLLSKCFTCMEATQQMIKFTNAIVSKKESIVSKKLHFIASVVSSDFVLSDQKAFDLLTSSVVQWLQCYLGWSDPESSDVTLRALIFTECVDVFSQLLSKLEIISWDPDRHTETGKQLVVLLPKLLELSDDLESADGTVEPVKGNSLRLGKETLPILEVTSKPVVQFQSGNVQPTIKDQASTGDARKAFLFISILNYLPETVIQEHLFDFYMSEGAEFTKKFIMQVLQIFSAVQSGDAFPPLWLNSIFISQKVAVKAFRVVAITMKEVYLPPKTQSFDGDLWTALMTSVFRCFSLPCFGIQSWTAQKWRLVHVLHIPIVLQAAAELLGGIWHALGTTTAGKPVVEYQMELIPTIIPLALDLTISSQEDLYMASSLLLSNILSKEYAVWGNIKRVESLCVDRFDSVILGSSAEDDVYRRRFAIFIRHALFHNDASSELKLLTEAFLSNVDHFLFLLFSLRSLPPGNEYEEEQWNGIYKIAKFMKAIGRNENYIRYVHHLACKQRDSRNPVEAAYSLKLHSDLLSWTDNIVGPIPAAGFESPQRECDRKEELLHQILLCFAEGKAFENAIGICKELTFYYEEVAYNYKKLGEILQSAKEYYMAISEQERYFSEYFRVGYYGMGFPASIRNKQFIYRGLEWEKIGAFCEKIQSRHPDSILLKSNALPKDEILRSDGRYLQITAVQAEPDRNLPIFVKGTIVPDYVRIYHEYNNINVFSVSRPFRKGEKSGNEFLDLWTEKTTYSTQDSFPYQLRRSEVIDSSVSHFSPIENALQTMVAKNRDLIVLEKKYEKFMEPQANCNPLTMCINGAVDAPVNGGVLMYKKAFINSTFRFEYPDKELLVTKLEEALDEQVIILDRCLVIHNRIAPAQMRPLHDTIVKCTIFFWKITIAILHAPSLRYETNHSFYAPLATKQFSKRTLLTKSTA